MFVCEGVSYAAFSGNGTRRNNPRSGGVADNGPILPGRYYIVGRQSGGHLSGFRDFATGRNEWFALYRDDGAIDDQTFIGGVRRGEFRLHPLGPSGMSLGCIVIQNPTDFTALRSRLLAAAVNHIPGTTTRHYGTVEVVTAPMIDTLDPRHRGGSSSEVA
jgi:hypothetical protein